MSVNIRSLYLAGEGHKRAVLLINLGSPASAEVQDVKPYLTQFLMDERVISIPYFWRALLVKGIIVPQRAAYSAANYRSIWEEETETFPLVRHSASIAYELSQRMQCPVALGMRYGSPSMDDALRALVDLGVEEVMALPLYPHYTRSSYETAAIYALEHNRRLGLGLNIRLVPPFYAHPAYRRVLAEQIRPYLEQPYDKLLVSLHGIPVSHLSAVCRQHNGQTDYCYTRPHTHAERWSCYRLHCETTLELLRADLALPADRVELVYQSRLGRHEWIKPYLSERIKALPREGCRRVLVVCPGFVCDCLETIYEIDVEYREEFLASGGEQFTYIPCLNSNSDFVSVLSEIIRESHSLENNPISYNYM